ncbi:MAG: VapC toxin family PIN domain ribonuclease [Nitrospirae bacterium CG17_big_fil_post_rev_8_21_14_2_50_50_9]|nr:MAG: VapC toxin family PIN domain ribonuclease [Nitrospirae bacterium CG17_big_fil_post_rev_8_21_14_2_50_50_9]
MKNKRILVDTSAWVLSFKSSGHDKIKSFLKEAIDLNQIVITPFIILELLQGCKTEKEFDVLKTRLDSLESFTIEEMSWEEICGFGFSLRRKGLTIPTMDILIAFLAIEKDLTLLHHDHHFRLIAKHSKLNAMDYMS